MKKETIRATQHSSRDGHPDHNDRSYYEDHPMSGSHIDHDMSRYNKSYTWTQDDVDAMDMVDDMIADGSIPDTVPGGNFASDEYGYYLRTFSDALAAQNERYRSKRQYDSIRDMGDWYNDNRRKPEEVILQVGSIRNDQQVDADTLWSMTQEYIGELNAWNDAHGKPMQVLNYALHADESTNHVQLRRVWQYRDNEGNLNIGQEAALEQAGVPLPDPSKPKDRYNNRKQTFDAEMRAKWLDICESHGIAVERTPLPRRKSKKISKYIHDKETEMRERETSVANREQSVTIRERAVSAQEADIQRKRQKMQNDEGELKKKLDEADRLVDDAEKMWDDADQALYDAMSMPASAFAVWLQVSGHSQEYTAWIKNQSQSHNNKIDGMRRSIASQRSASDQADRMAAALADDWRDRDRGSSYGLGD